MKKTMLYFSVLCVATFVINSMAVAQKSNSKSPDMEKAKVWANGREWAKGLNLKVSGSVNPIEFYNQYHRNTSSWDKAFEYLKNTDLNKVAPGKYNLDGDNVYAIVSEGPTKAITEAKWESHRKYIDIQYVIRGKEKMGVAPLSKAGITEAYDDAKDVAFYSVPEKDSKYYTAAPGTFLIFFPGEAHRPGIKSEGNDTDKKVVVKVRYAE